MQLKRITRRCRPLTCVALVAALGAAACGTEPRSDGLVVGVVLDYSGSDTADGFLVERGALLAAELMAESRPDGEAFRLEFRNAQGNPERARQHALDLVEEGAVAVLGPSFDGLVEAVGTPLNEAGVLLVSPTATTGLESAEDSPWVRLSPGNSSGSSAATLFGENLAKSLLDEGFDRVGVLVGDDLYNSEFASAFGATFSRLGGDASSVIAMPSSLDASGVVAQVLRNDGGVQGHVLAVELLSASKLITEVASVRSEAARWFLTPRLKSDLLLVNTPPRALSQAIGVAPRIASAHQPCDPSRLHECFEHQYRTRWNDNPPDEAYFMYDATAVLLIALERLSGQGGDPPGRERLMAEILDVASLGGVQVGWNDFSVASDRESEHVQYVGLTGPIIFDADGTRRSGNTVLWRIEDDKIVHDD